MPWVRLDDNFYKHPKVVKAGPLGIAMQVAGLCYCNTYLTDGFIPSSIVPGLLNLDGIGMRMWSNDMIGGGEDATWTIIVEDLVNAGLWELTEGGYMIHDYLDFQPSKAQVMAEREANAKRQEEWRKSHRDGSGKYNANSNAVTNASYNTAPNPVPNPVPNPQSQIPFGADAPASPRDQLRFDKTPEGALLAQKLRAVYESNGRRPPEFYENSKQRDAYLTAFSALGSKAATLLDSAMESNITSRGRLLKWLQGCVKKNGSGPHVESKIDRATAKTLELLKGRANGNA